MITRKKIAVFVDYSIRIPSFKAAYDNFKQEMFANKLEDIPERDVDNDPMANYWAKEVVKPEVQDFYGTKYAPENDMDMKAVDMRHYFFNDEHYERFVDEYSYNMYVDSDIPTKDDIALLNLAQQKLFDVTIVDEVRSRRKISNTLFFLSKNAIYPQSIIFLMPGQNINLDNYIGVWNPRVNPDQVNSHGNKTMLNWLMELEKQVNVPTESEGTASDN